jgi:malonate-semialdehyde dehydrogenase (acetylating)/methylmalonate-semialdehyde dehydrogenase
VGYLQRLREICDRHGILLIFDEVITGFGRLGKPFALERFGVTPDMITCAKGITNGAVPMGAVFVKREGLRRLHAGARRRIEFFHGYTYSGHPLACAAGLATLDVYRDEGLLARAAELAERWEDALHAEGRAARHRHPQHRPDRRHRAGAAQRGLEVRRVCLRYSPSVARGVRAVRSAAASIDSILTASRSAYVAGITPFNFPAMVPLWMYPVAIACGNTFILKPSERDRLGADASRLEAADGGRAAPGRAQCACTAIKRGRRRAARCNPRHRGGELRRFDAGGRACVCGVRTQAGKRVQALGGAKNHLLVMPDADMDQAADALMGAGYGSAGERCMAISVAVPVGDKTADALVRRAQAARRGAARSARQPTRHARSGPLDHQAQHMSKMRRLHRRRCRTEGAELVVDGRVAAGQATGLSGGYFLGPTLFDHASSAMRIWREEIFGPLLVIVRVATPAAAVALVNEHEFANGVAIFTAMDAWPAT